MLILLQIRGSYMSARLIADIYLTAKETHIIQY